MHKILKTSDNNYMAIFDENGITVKSEHIPTSGATIIAEMKLRTWAKKMNMRVK